MALSVSSHHFGGPGGFGKGTRGAAILGARCRGLCEMPFRCQQAGRAVGRGSQSLLGTRDANLFLGRDFGSLRINPKFSFGINSKNTSVTAIYFLFTVSESSGSQGDCLIFLFVSWHCSPGQDLCPGKDQNYSYLETRQESTYHSIFSSQ